MEAYDVKTGKTRTYYMKDNPQNAYFPATKGYEGKINTIEKDKDSLVNNSVEKGGALKSIIGADNRSVISDSDAKRVPYKHIGKLITTFAGINNDRKECKASAFLVGKSIILTSAHNVYEPKAIETLGCFYPSLTSGNLNDMYKVEFEFKTIHIPKEYKNAVANGDKINMDKYDYALVELYDNPGKTYGYLALGGYNTTYNINYLVGKNATVVGYPQNKYKMYRHKGEILGFSSGNYNMYYKMDTSKGQDGGPVILPISGGKYYVVAINSSEGTYYNYGRYITKNIYDLVNKYK